MVKNFLLTMLYAVFIATNTMADRSVPFNLQGLQTNGKAAVTNEPHDDLSIPQYVSGSLAYELTDTIIDGHNDQNLRVSCNILKGDSEISSVMCRLYMATDFYYDEYGTYDPITQLAYFDIPITEYNATGDYYVDHITINYGTDMGFYVDFSDDPLHEPIKTIHVTTPNPDTIAPEMDLNVCLCCTYTSRGS